MAIDAARVTRIVVRRPAAWPVLLRSMPSRPPAITVRTRRMAISCQWISDAIGSSSGSPLRLLDEIERDRRALNPQQFVLLAFQAVIVDEKFLELVQKSGG